MLTSPGIFIAINSMSLIYRNLKANQAFLSIDLVEYQDKSEVKYGSASCTVNSLSFSLLSGF